MSYEVGRVLGGLYGLLVGDALGVPYEFKAAEELPAREQIEFEPPRGFARSHAGVPPGSWSDDGAQALCLLDSLLFNRDLELDDFGRRLVKWWRHGYLAADGRVFDIGVQTSRALSRVEAGVPAAEAGPCGEMDNGNGSLMRVLPVALWHAGSDEDLFWYACRQSVVTHGHIRSQICCGLYCLWARGVLMERDSPWQAALEQTRELVGDRPSWASELVDKIERPPPAGCSGTGYVVDCLHSAKRSCDGQSFEDCVRAAVSIGNDTDTTAAVAGGIAGLRFGYSAIPRRWIDGLRDRQVVEQLGERLLLRLEAGAQPAMGAVG